MGKTRKNKSSGSRFNTKLSHDEHNRRKSKKNVFTAKTPSHTNAKGKRRRVILPGSGQEFPTVILGATDHKNHQHTKSKIYKHANSVPDNSVRSNRNHALGRTNGFINSPNSRYPNGKKIAKTATKKDLLSSIPGKKTNYENPIGTFTSRSYEIGKATNL